MQGCASRFRQECGLLVVARRVLSMCSRITLCCVPLLAAHCGSVAKNPAGSETPAVVGRPSLVDPQTRTSRQNKNDGIDERTLATIRRMTDLLRQGGSGPISRRRSLRSTHSPGASSNRASVPTSSRASMARLPTKRFPGISYPSWGWWASPVALKSGRTKRASTSMAYPAIDISAG